MRNLVWLVTALAVASSAFVVEADAAGASSLVEAGLALQARGEHVRARRYFENAVEVFEADDQAFGTPFAGALHSYAATLIALRQLDDAETQLRRAWPLLDTRVPEQRVEVGAIENDLGVVFDLQERPVLALQAYMRAFEIFDHDLPADDARVSAVVVNVGALHDTQGMRSLAERCFVAVLAHTAGARASESMRARANALNNLAVLYRDQGRYAAMRPMLTEALDLFIAAEGPDHPDVAMNHVNLAVLAEIEARDKDAEDGYLKAITIRERSLGSANPEVARTRALLAAFIARRETRTTRSKPSAQPRTR